MKKEGIRYILFFLLLFFLMAEVSLAVTVQVGKDTVITEMDAHDFVVSPPYNVEQECYSKGNTVYVRFHASGEGSGNGSSWMGATIEWDLGEYTWEEVTDWPIKVTINFSYSITARMKSPDLGMAAAFVILSAPSPSVCFCSCVEQPSKAFCLGISKQFKKCSVTTGRTGYLSTTFITTLNGGVVDARTVSIHAQVYSNCASTCYKDEYGNQICGDAYSEAQLTIDSIKIEFLDYKKISRGKPKDSNASQGEPVNVVNGNMYIIKTDLSTPAPGMPFEFKRTYNSLSDSDGPLGYGWTHNFNVSLNVPEDDSSSAIISGPDGKIIIFSQIEPGVFKPPLGEYSSLVKTENGYIWKLKNKIQYEFDLDGKLIAIKDKNNNTISLFYDNNGHLITITDTAGRNYELKYDSSDHIVEIKDPIGRKVSYQYNSTGNLIKVVDPEGTITQYEYNDPNDPHNITRQVVGNKFVYAYKYNDQDQCIWASSPENKNGFSFEYHIEDGYTVATDSKGYKTTKYYNEYGMITKIVYPDRSERRFTYDENLNKILEVDQQNATWRYEYDSRGNLTKVIDPLRNERKMTYNENDDLTSVTDELGRTTKYEYDKNGNLLKITYPDGSKTTFSYNQRGQPLTITDEEGNTVHFFYDEKGNLIKVTDQEGNAITYTYDDIGRILTKKDANGNITSYQYDNLNRIIKINDPKGGIVEITYDMEKIGSVKDQNSNLYSFQYDTLSQLVKVTDPLGNVKELIYDLNGNIISQKDFNGNIINYIYDNLNRLREIRYPDSTKVVFSYDAVGNIIEMKDLIGTSAFTYDLLGRITSYTNPFGLTVKYSYDKVGNLKSLTYPNNKSVEYEYDLQNRLTKVVDWQGRETRFIYNKKGLISEIHLPNGCKVQYEYDKAGRLINLQNIKSDGEIIASYSYLLDKNGNVVSETVNQPLLPKIASQSVTYTYGLDNQLLMANDLSFGYDKNGNLIKKGDITYQFDYQNRLKKVNSAYGTYEYYYDGLGHRIGINRNGNVRYFVIDPRGMSWVLGEYDQNGKLLTYYVYGIGLLYKVDANGNAYYYHYNSVGHTVAITDEAGNIINKYAYTPFGELAGIEETVENSFRYVGRFGVMDDGNGLLYMRARYYDPEAGRFISRDPIGFAGGWNLYGYVGGNPLRWIDPWGLCKDENKEIVKETILSVVLTVIGEGINRVSQAVGSLFAALLGITQGAEAWGRTIIINKEKKEELKQWKKKYIGPIGRDTVYEAGRFTNEICVYCRQ